MKIWAKLLIGDKIVKETIYSSTYPSKYVAFQLWIRDICDILDIPSPVIIPNHYKNFALFNNARFRPDDFVESIKFDMLLVENCKE